MDVLLIPLGRGFVTRVDSHLWETDLTYSFRTGEQFSARPSSIHWHAQKNRNYWYAFGHPYIEGRQRLVALHRLLLQAPAEFHVDHRDGDPLNNRLANLRLCTHSQNQANRPAMGGASRFKGVATARGCRNRWRAQIQQQRADGTFRRVCLGQFESEEDAARAYDAAALLKYGEFARLNFPVNP